VVLKKTTTKNLTKMEEKKKKRPSATEVVKEIKRRTKRIFSPEEKIRIVLEGLRGEDSIAAICRKYDLHINTYYSWSKEFMEAGKRRLSGDITREATRDEVSDLKAQNDDLKKVLADLYLENKSLKKSLNGYE
jgi:transposase